MISWRKQPGLVVSAVAHAGLLAATLVVFSDARKFEDVQEYVPVEVVSDQQFNQIMKGDKTARPAKPELRVDKIAQETETRPQPPLAEAKRDVSAPPPPKPREPQSEDEPAASKPVAAATKAPAKAPSSEPEKREPDKAEVTRPKPPRPTPEQKAEDTPQPPEKQKKPKREQPRLRVDEVAKLLAQEKRDEKGEKPTKPKSSDETAPKSKFNAARIADLLSREAPQRRASTGKEATHIASLGAPTADAPRMSPSLQAQIDGYTIEHYRKCWVAALSTNAPTYVPRVELRFTRDGALEEQPRLVNPSSDPVERSRGEQALAAVRRCSPMPVPPAFAPYYDYWRLTELDMREDM